MHTLHRLEIRAIELDPHNYARLPGARHFAVRTCDDYPVRSPEWTDAHHSLDSGSRLCRLVEGEGRVWLLERVIPREGELVTLRRACGACGRASLVLRSRVWVDARTDLEETEWPYTCICGELAGFRLVGAAP